jgi:putative oxidoreductase
VLARKRYGGAVFRALWGGLSKEGLSFRGKSVVVSVNHKYDKVAVQRGQTMKTTALISRILLGLIFTVFGVNGLHPFLPMAPPPGELASRYIGALFQSHYTVVIFLVQLIGGVLLLVNRYVPFALTILGPVLVNILCFHSLMSPSGLPPALVTTILWFIVFYYYRRSFAGIFEAKPI